MADGTKTEIITEQIRNYWTNLDRRFELNDKLERLKEYAIAHPILSLLVLIGIGTCGLPVGIFISFAVGTIFLTFIGFVFVEGTILTIGGCILLMILSVVGFISFGLMGVVIVAYFVFNRCYKYYKGNYVRVNDETTTNYRYEDSNGYCKSE